jgi:hypothetical protein
MGPLPFKYAAVTYCPDGRFLTLYVDLRRQGGHYYLPPGPPEPPGEPPSLWVIVEHLDMAAEVRATHYRHRIGPYEWMVLDVIQAGPSPPRHDDGLPSYDDQPIMGPEEF